MSGDRVLAVGQWLGTHNRIVSMRWYETLGWTATDSTGARYQQFHSGTRLGLRDGLPTADEPVSCMDLPYTPWPPEPKDDGS